MTQTLESGHVRIGGARILSSMDREPWRRRHIGTWEIERAIHK